MPEAAGILLVTKVGFLVPFEVNEDEVWMGFIGSSPRAKSRAMEDALNFAYLILSKFCSWEVRIESKPREAI